MKEAQLEKAFRKWNRAFSTMELDLCELEWNGKIIHIPNMPTITDRWTFGYSQPSSGSAQWCAYEAPEHKDWQCFRVMLKSLNTYGKIRMLSGRWLLLVDKKIPKRRLVNLADASTAEIELVRIMNYIGALKRGGQLDDSLHIVR